MVSIIIPVYNNHDMTHECIYSVLEDTQDCEIIIIDNGSSPPFQPPFSGFIETKVIRNTKNLGFPVAVNQGIKASIGDVVVLLNNDVIVPKGAIKRLTSWLEHFSIVGPVTNYCAGLQKTTIETYTTKEELDKAADGVSTSNQGFAEYVNWVIGFCMVFKRSLYDEIGEFDESLWPCSGEEIDFCFRAVDAGHKIGIAYDVYMHHFGSQTFMEMEKEGQLKYDETCTRNDAHLARKWGHDFWQRQSIEGENNEGERFEAKA